MRKPAARLHTLACVAAICVAAGTAVLVLHDDYGATWDEGAQARYGELALDYFASAGSDGRVHEFFNLKYYGPFLEMVAAAAYRDHPERKFEIRHLITGLFALLAIPGLALFSSLFRDPRVVVMAPVALLMLPRFSGHAFNNSKDVPFAVAVTLFFALVSRLFVRNDYSWKAVLLAGAGLGLAMSIRPGGLLLLGAYLVVIALVCRIFLGPSPAVRAPALRVAVLLGTAWLLMFLVWPWAHTSPIGSLVDATALAMAFPEPIAVFFEGRHIASTDLPSYYL
ncbi:MAG: hypothetical protein ACRELC_02090, partial [Gemmatimonadota bacterium]